MKKCLVELSDASAGLGDILVLMPYLEKFRTSYDFEIFFMSKNISLSSLFIDSFPNIRFISHDSEVEYDKRITLVHTKHNLPLQQIFATQLGFMDAPYIRPTVDLPECQRQIKNKYVCISTHSTAQLKFWNHPNGVHDQQFSSNWNDLCSMLRKSGYTPVCVDYYQDFGTSPFYNFVPVKSVKKLGLTLQEVLKLIQHCEFFIGLSSGLTWLAHAAGKPVCMISNFTEDWHEIDLSVSDYIRITNKSVCHGCWNLVGQEFEFNYTDWYWCPRHKDTERQFECHKSITPEMVFEKLKLWIN
jgi:autotransporter strand-loop-strand O-heptosyltransferase